jgi:hypothetical protein
VVVVELVVVLLARVVEVVVDVDVPGRVVLVVDEVVVDAPGRVVVVEVARVLDVLVEVVEPARVLVVVVDDAAGRTVVSCFAVSLE